MWPDEFYPCDGYKVIAPGVVVSQQSRTPFGMCYRTSIGTDVNPEAGYKLHLVYGATVNPSEKAYQTVNESPDGVTFSWEVSCIPVTVTGSKPTSLIVIDSTKATPAKLAALETILYGAISVDPRLPLPNEISTLMNDSQG